MPLNILEGPVAVHTHATTSPAHLSLGLFSPDAFPLSIGARYPGGFLLTM